MIAVMSSFSFLRALAAAGEAHQVVTLGVKAGSALFRDGDPAPGLPFVVSGKIELVRWTADGRPMRMHRANAGETFAEASVFAGTCHCDARAMVDSVVELLPREAVLRGIERRRP